MRSLPRAAQIFVCGVVALAVAAVAEGPFHGIDWWAVAVLAVLFLVCESASTTISERRATLSLSYAATLASVVLVGPVGAALVGTAAVFSTRRNLLLVQRVFNGAQYALSAYVAGLVFHAVGGVLGVPTSHDFPGVIGPFAAADVAYLAANGVLVGGILLLTREGERPSPRKVRWVQSATLLLSYLGYGAFGLLIAALWATIGAFSAVLVLLPLFVARWAFGQYAAQQQAYDATIAALCQAVETKDYYTRGHCVRVSRASVMIAREIGMRVERIEAIRYAGMLHDVGKLGVPTKVLQKSGPLTEEEFAAIQLHPMRGLEIVREIGFLDEALAGIMHHHERIDGKGYPMGLAGDEIPEFARVIAVADAFDSMTSTRSYRNARSVPDAIAELRKWSGSQFDPVMVDALVKAIGQEGWDPPHAVGPPEDEVVETAQQDHDDPSVPLRVMDDPRP